MIAHRARSALLLLLLLLLAALLLVLRVAIHVGAISILGYRAVRRGLGLHVRRRRRLGDVSGLDERAGGCRARPGSHALLGGAGSAVDHRAAPASRGGGGTGTRLLLLLLHELLLLSHRRALLGRLIILLLARDGAHGDVLHALHLLLARIVLHHHLGLDVLEMAGGHGLLLLLGGRSVPGLLPVVVVVHCGRLPGTRNAGQEAAGTAVTARVKTRCIIHHVENMRRGEGQRRGAEGGVTKRTDCTRARGAR